MLGLDFDGVLANTPKRKAQLAYELFGIRIEPGMMEKGHVLGAGLLSPTEYRIIQSIVYEDEFGTAAIEPLRGARDVVARLKADGFKVLVVTARYGKSLDNAKLRLTKNGFAIPIVGVGPNGKKSRKCEDVSVFLDDTAEQLHEIALKVPHRYLLGWKFNEIHWGSSDFQVIF